METFILTFSSTYISFVLSPHRRGRDEILDKTQRGTKFTKQIYTKKKNDFNTTQNQIKN